jgi:hypothetical protein
MTKKFASLDLIILMACSAIAQSNEPAKKTGRPDIPGTFTLELGINRLTEKPNELKYGFWGSRSLNVYYQYDMRIGKSKFSFHPGIGLGMERLKFVNSRQYFSNDTISLSNPTLMFDNAGNTMFVDAGHFIYDGDTLGQIDLSGSFRAKKSMLSMNYLDIPVELRFSTKPDDPARSFKIAIGGRAGYLLNAHTKIKYREDGEVKKLKTYQAYNLSRFRYGVYMKVYLGNFALFGYYNLNTLFEDKKGPAQTQAQTYTIGISLASF